MAFLFPMLFAPMIPLHMAKNMMISLLRWLHAPPFKGPSFGLTLGKCINSLRTSLQWSSGSNLSKTSLMATLICPLSGTTIKEKGMVATAFHLQTSSKKLLITRTNALSLGQHSLIRYRRCSTFIMKKNSHGPRT